MMPLVRFPAPRGCTSSSSGSRDAGTVVHAMQASLGVHPRNATAASTSGRAYHATHHQLQTNASPALQRRCGVQTAASKRTSVASSLIAVLKDEMKYERESYRKDDLLEVGPPNDFEVVDERGTSCFLLTKQFGDEEVVVRVNLDLQPEFDPEDEGEEDYDEDDEELPTVEFVVTIGKDGSDDVLSFECESDGEYLTIRSVSLESLYDKGPLLGPSPDAPPYRGPLFDDLDDTLQQAFVDFLEERGVNAYLGEFIRRYLDDKGANEYVAWLGRMRDFIAK